MATHHFPVRAHARPAAGLAGLGYVPPFASEQNQAFKISLGGCDCKSSLSGNWYFYPEDQRQMYGLGFLNNTLFTVPLVNFPVTTKRALVGVAGALAVAWLMRR